MIEPRPRRGGDPRVPMPIDRLDHLIGAHPSLVVGSIALFDASLPEQAGCPDALWDALRIRTELRRREAAGPPGDALRILAALGHVRFDEVSRAVLVVDGTTATRATRATIGRLLSRVNPRPTRRGGGSFARS